MKILSEKIIRYKDVYCGTADIITGIDDFVVPDTIYDDGTHTYYYKNKPIPSVTQLLDDGLYDNVNEEILKKACERGILIHEEIEHFIKEQKEGNSNEFYQFKILFIKYNYLFNSEAIFDVKTYANVDKEKKIKAKNQMQAYANGIKELTNEEIKDFYIIHLPKNKKGEIIKL